MLWSLLILSLPSQNTTARMRAWRALKAAGAAVLRDGVYLLPAGDAAQAVLDSVADDVRAHEGTAHVLGTEAPQDDFAALFDRAADWGVLLAETGTARSALAGGAPEHHQRQARKLRKAADALLPLDFFPGEAQRQTLAALDELEAAAARLLAPDEPQPLAAQAITRRALAEHRGRVWATRARPWVDRLACAWLIRRFIDPEARFVWLAQPADCPADALGFDFDGATFSHVGSRVSFETLLASFALNSPALNRLGLLVHALDVGGVMPPEAPGVERVLAGMRDALTDDDQLLNVAAGVFEGLLITFEKELS